MSSNARFSKDLDAWLPIGVLCLGLLLTSLVTFALANAARLKNSAQNLADVMSLQARQREIQLDAVLDNTPDVIITADRHGTIIRANHTVKRLLGYESEALVGRNVAVLMSDADAAQHDQYIERYHRRGHASVIGRDRELWAKHADGHLVPIEVNLNQFELDGTVFLVAQIRDISLRLQGENELRASQRQLSMIVDSAGLGTWDLNIATGEAYFGGIYGEMLGFNTQELYITSRLGEDWWILSS